jgi:diguanylate cyclase
MSAIISHVAAAGGGILATSVILGARIRSLRLRLAAAAHDASHDPLTGLANRRGVLSHIETALRQRTPVGIILLDLDNFKVVNDSPGVGHPGGDLLLRRVARLLWALPPPARLAARLGGDEFVLVVDGDAETTAAVADEVWQLVTGAPFTVAGRQFRLRASVGYVGGRRDVSAPELLRNADEAMYDAKSAGGGIAAYRPATSDQT